MRAGKTCAECTTGEVKVPTAQGTARRPRRRRECVRATGYIAELRTK